MAYFNYRVVVGMNVQAIIEKLNLKPLPFEGGYYFETYRSDERISLSQYSGERSLCTAIYYLLTPDTFSAIHRLKSDEIFHFYAGDPVEMLLLYPDGSHSVITIGPDVANGQQPQVVVPKLVWQGCRLIGNGNFALMGTTVSPGFEFEDFELGDRDLLMKEYPSISGIIEKYTRE